MPDINLDEVRTSAVLGKRLWSRADKIFIMAGLLLAVTSVLNGITLFTTRSILGPVTFLPEFLGPLMLFIGLLGLLPYVAEHLRRVALGCALLLMFPVIATLLGLIFFMQNPNSDPWFIVGLYMTIYVGFALGITVMGASIIYTRVPSRSIGVSLLIFAAPWYGIAMVRGLTPTLLDFVAFGMMAVGLLSTGYLLRTGEVQKSPPWDETYGHHEGDSGNAGSEPPDARPARSRSPEPRYPASGIPNREVTHLRRSTRSLTRTRRNK